MYDFLEDWKETKEEYEKHTSSIVRFNFKLKA